MAVVKPDAKLIKTEYDRCDQVIKSCHSVTFDLKDLVDLVDAQASKGLAGSALSVPPPRLRQLCNDKIVNLDPSQQQQQQQYANRAKLQTPTSGLLFSDGNEKSGAPSSKPSTFSQAIWDKGVHLFRLLRHLGRPLHTVPVLEYLPGELLQKIDQYNTELELLLLRSRSGKGSDDELCFQFVRGCCPRGASCSFAHSKLAVSMWSQRWAGEHLRDYTQYRQLLKQHRLSLIANRGLTPPTNTTPRKAAAAGMLGLNDKNLGPASPLVLSPIIPKKTTTVSDVDAKSNKKKGNEVTTNKAAFDQQQSHNVSFGNFGDGADVVPETHDFNSGAMLRFSEAIGPEAFSIVLDMLHQRDEYFPEVKTGKESPLKSIIIRHPIPKPVFDVLCSSIDLSLFADLKLIDLSKCELGSACGKSRLAKLGRVIRRSASGRYENRITLCLGTNNLSNYLSSAFLNAFVSAGEETQGNDHSKHKAFDGNNNNNTGSFAGLSFASANAAAQIAINAVRDALIRQEQQQQQTHNKGASATAATEGSHASFTATELTTVFNGNMIMNHLQPSSSSALAPGAAVVKTAAQQQREAAAAQSVTASAAAMHLFDTSLIPDDETSHPLLSLNLEFNNIGPAQPDFTEFLAALQDALPNIEKLSLAGNPIVYDGALRMFPSWKVNSAAATTHNNHSQINQQQNVAASTSTKQNPVSTGGTAALPSIPQTLLSFTSFCAIQYLDVSACGLGDRGVNLLCDAIKFNHNTVKYLNVGWNGITSSDAGGGATALADLLRQRTSLLKCLRCDYSPQIGRRGAIIFSQAIKENTTIRRLDMKWCGISDEGALAMLDSLGPSRNMSLAVFKFDVSEVDPRTKEALDEKLKPIYFSCEEEMRQLEMDIVW